MSKSSSGMYAIVQLQGKQYRVAVGDTLVIDRMETAGEKLEVSDVLFLNTGSKLVFGSPLVKNATVSFNVVNHQKGEKIRVATYKAKSRYRRVKGHRQAQTVLEVSAISA